MSAVLTDAQIATMRFAADALEGLDYEDTAGELRDILRELPAQPGIPAPVVGALDVERAAFEKYEPDAKFSRAGAVYANPAIQVMWELWQAGSKYAYIEAIKIQNRSIDIRAQQAGGWQAVAVPDAWPTDDMVVRGAEHLHDKGYRQSDQNYDATEQQQDLAESLFKAMLATAPLPPQSAAQAEDAK